MRLIKAHPEWDESVVGEAGIQRARSFAASVWLRETTEDVFFMLDDDIVFEPEDAVRLVERCRSGYDIIGAGYPFRDGSHMAVRTFPGDTSLAFGPDAPPHEVRHVATGFLAIHRRVLEAMVTTLPLCNAVAGPGAFWPFFDFSIIEDPEAGGFSYLSEDYTFGERARALGFKVWLDRSIFLGHMGEVQITMHNMAAIKAALAGG